MTKKLILIKHEGEVSIFTTLAKACRHFNLPYSKLVRKKFPFWHEGYHVDKRMI